MNPQLSLISGVKKFTFIAAFFACSYMPLNLSAQMVNVGQPTVSFTEVAKKAIPAVVSIRVESKAKESSSISFNGREYEFEDPFNFFGDDLFKRFFNIPRNRPESRVQRGQASGFIVSKDGYILTNGHVVNGADEITVVLNDGREFDAEVVGIDQNTDIAVIKVDAMDLPFLSLGNSDEQEVGQWVVAVGNPLGLQASVTAGVVSAKGRNNLDLNNIEDFIQTDAAINRGNSGGPLLNLKGEVIGMNTAIVTNMGTGGYMGIGFAIPSNMASHVMKELIEHGSISRGFLGVTLQQITRDLAQAFNLNTLDGALVSDVTKGSPADKAGIRQGDIILEYDRIRVKNIGSLRNAVSLKKPNTKMNLTVLREGRKIMIPLTVGAYPDGQKTVSAKENRLGLEVETLTPETSRRLGYHDLTGVIVMSVEPGSAAERVGIRKGALIVAINHQQIESVEDFNQFLSNTPANQPVLLLIKQGDFMHFVSIKTG